MFVFSGELQAQNRSIFRVYFNDLVGIRNRMDVKFDWHTLLGKDCNDTGVLQWVD